MTVRLRRDLDRRLEELYRKALARIEMGRIICKGAGPAGPICIGEVFRCGNKRYYIGARFPAGRRGDASYNGYLEVGRPWGKC